MRFDVWGLEFAIQILSIALMRDEHRVRIQARVLEIYLEFGVDKIT